ncbi:Long-chain-fatty-acid--AMP ligase FadD32 [Corynebacterium ciconiae DSM 44920]|uniref:FadD32-like long-chain-fatty-acid--AMP ligase n=1 Tax=Corynebacterium ciconiae TaxID=227319 RepID=UPI00036B3C8F|nr:FadD32-like long-chain-fatty-acid--AMP ligase [Corynebacterium ciconiae]WKD60245.1 Long-chain-fatty-acid--AMP ligase FadD32 [Corynebacterium ciconiae DSM 44920]
MDLNAVLGKFFDNEGNIVLPPMLSLAGLAEMSYQAGAAQGDGDRVCLSYWDFSSSREGELITYTRAQINTRIKAVAARLQQVGGLGDRVAIMANNSPEYIFGFLGALYAGTVPVPLYDPTEPGHAEHLRAVFADCAPSIVLTNKRTAAAVRGFFAELPGAERPRVLTVDALPDSTAEKFTNPMADPQAMASRAVLPLDMPAFLQYTSGSTRTPAGVVLSNRSIITNVLQIFRAVDIKFPLRLSTWLPLHHDMGIILAIFVTILGLPQELMSPRDFVQQPSRWINQLNRREGDQHIYTVAPNFALELAARYTDQAQELDLSAVEGLICGSEPVTEAAVESFLAAFEPRGFRRTALRPSYGLAEASLMVSTPQSENRPVISHFDRAALAEGRAEIAEKSDATVAFASNGAAVPTQLCTIVDPETRTELPDGVVGEIWAHGDNMAQGYLDRPEETVATFRNRLAGKMDNSRVPTAPEDGYWMATGDLGVMFDGELYITGRLKDLIVIAGRNHYPQDIEYTVASASEHVRPNCVAAFAIDGDDVEKLVILAERDLQAQADGDEQAIRDIRAAVVQAHGVQPHEVRILAPEGIARSSSGKIARKVSQREYLATI